MGIIRAKQAISDPDLPASIARDLEFQAADAAHVAASDPHAQYLLQSEGDARYRQLGVALTDSDIPSTIARDTETTAAINAHMAAADPHAQYLTQSKGDGRYRQSSVALTTSDMPLAMATDAEVVAAINAHTAASDPHPQYLKAVNNFDFTVVPLALAANTWKAVGDPIIVGEQGKGSTWLINIYFQYTDTTGGTNYPYFQYCGSATLGCIYWQADNFVNEGVSIPVEAHNEADFTMRVRFGRGQNRQLEIKPDRSINIVAPGFFQARGVRLQ